MLVKAKKTLTAKGVRMMMDAALAKAAELGITVTVAIVDDGGHLLMLERMEGGRFHTVHSATTKAVTAASNKRPTSSKGAQGQELDVLHALGLTLAAGPQNWTAMEGGYEVFAFHSNGTGGEAMEELAVEGMLDGLFDLSTHEITDEIFGGIHAGDANRLLAGGLKGIPRLVVPGGLDIITLRELETIPDIYRNQPYVKHNPHITLVRLTVEQMVRVADVMVARLNQATAPVIVAIPKGGFSFYNKDGLHFRDIEADEAFIQTLKMKLKPEIEICELDGHVNDPVFIEAILSIFERLMQPQESKKQL